MTADLMSVWFLVKILFLAAFLVYLAFAGIVVRQVYLMTETLEVGFETTLQTLAWAHFIFSLSVFVFALFLL